MGDRIPRVGQVDRDPSGETRSLPSIESLAGRAGAGTYFVLLYPCTTLACNQDGVFFIQQHPEGPARTRIVLTSCFPGAPSHTRVSRSSQSSTTIDSTPPYPKTSGYPKSSRPAWHRRFPPPAGSPPRSRSFTRSRTGCSIGCSARRPKGRPPDRVYCCSRVLGSFPRRRHGEVRLVAIAHWRDGEGRPTRCVAGGGDWRIFVRGAGHRIGFGQGEKSSHCAEMPARLSFDATIPAGGFPW